MVKWNGLLSCLGQVSIAVIGDYLYDIYIKGKVNRISAEAPVPILQTEQEEGQLGGAGNVIQNLSSLGAKVVAIGRLGNDIPGQKIFKTLSEGGINVEATLFQSGFPTPVKTRFMAGGQQLLRVDCEKIIPISHKIEREITGQLDDLLNQVQIVVISDYGKGLLSSFLLTHLIHSAKAKKLQIIVDPKGKDFTRYRGATILKPNLQEAYAATNLDPSTPLDKVAKFILRETESKILMVTRSEEGISVFDNSGSEWHFPVRSKEVRDVTGAGDTVLAVTAFALANHIDIRKSAQLANIAASLVIERSGCSSITLTELTSRLMELDIQNKVFEGSSLSLLQKVLKYKKTSMLVIKEEREISNSLMQHIKELAILNEVLVLYIEDGEPDYGFINTLASLGEVNFILLKYESFQQLCDLLNPTKVCFFQNKALI